MTRKTMPLWIGPRPTPLKDRTVEEMREHLQQSGPNVTAWSIAVVGAAGIGAWIVIGLTMAGVL